MYATCPLSLTQQTRALFSQKAAAMTPLRPPEEVKMPPDIQLIAHCNLITFAVGDAACHHGSNAGKVNAGAELTAFVDVTPPQRLTPGQGATSRPSFAYRRG